MNFLELEKDKTYVVRCVKNPWQYFCHSNLVLIDQAETSQKIKCSLMHDGKCAICDHFKQPPETRWILVVLNWKTCKLHLVDIGFDIFNTIREYFKDPDWGDPINYDMSLFYNEDQKLIIYPKPGKKLTYTEHNWIEKDFNDYYMQFLVNPPSFEQTQEMIQYQDYKIIK